MTAETIIAMHNRGVSLRHLMRASGWSRLELSLLLLEC